MPLFPTEYNKNGWNDTSVSVILPAHHAEASLLSDYSNNSHGSTTERTCEHSLFTDDRNLKDLDQESPKFQLLSTNYRSKQIADDKSKHTAQSHDLCTSLRRPSQLSNEYNNANFVHDFFSQRPMIPNDGLHYDRNISEYLTSLGKEIPFNILQAPELSEEYIHQLDSDATLFTKSEHTTCPDQSSSQMSYMSRSPFLKHNPAINELAPELKIRHGIQYEGLGYRGSEDDLILQLPLVRSDSTDTPLVSINCHDNWVRGKNVDTSTITSSDIGYQLPSMLPTLNSRLLLQKTDQPSIMLASRIDSFEQAVKRLPLVVLGCNKKAAPANESIYSSPWNVVKIENIPYNLDDEMLFEFLGKNIGLLPEEHGGIHIIMDRTTGKTMDCFLEFSSGDLAERFINRRSGGHRRCVLGGRHILLELVKRGELMTWLFPKLRGLTWDDCGHLKVRSSTDCVKKEEIISREELVMILGHARTPHRSPFSRKCLQRPYESLMSIVTTFPWDQIKHYSLKQRDLLFQACFEAGDLLNRQILRGRTGPNINARLLHRLCRIISLCPGFTLRQKVTFLKATTVSASEYFLLLQKIGTSHRLATQFQALSVLPGSDEHLLETFTLLITRGNSLLKSHKLHSITKEEGCSSSQQNHVHCNENGDTCDAPTCRSSVCQGVAIRFEVNQVSDLTMQEAANIELRHVYEALSQLLPHNEVPM